MEGEINKEQNQNINSENNENADNSKVVRGGNSNWKNNRGRGGNYKKVSQINFK